MRNRIYSGAHGGTTVEHSTTIVCCVYAAFMLLQMKIFREDKCPIPDHAACVPWHTAVILSTSFSSVDISPFNKNSNMYLYIRSDIHHF